MAVYFPQFADVFVFRNALKAENYLTLIVRDHEWLQNDPPSVVIDGVRYVYDEHGTERTRMHMRVQLQKRIDTGTVEEIAIASSVE